MAKLSAKDVTNLYLYGQNITSSNLLDEALIRSAGITVTTSIDKQTFMEGPGRFATGANFNIVAYFFDDPASNVLLPDTYTKAQIAQFFGLEDYGFNMHHYSYQDGYDDYAERTYIYNSPQYRTIFNK